MSKEFPNVRELAEASNCTSLENEDDKGRGCNCPTRMEAPEPPTYCPGTSLTELEELISSVFNTCERQKLTVMKVRLCQLYIDPKARPFAIHKCRPVAMHWEKQVKEGLDRDVTMGVIRVVSVGEPAKCCAPMQVVAKNSGPGGLSTSRE